MIINAGRSIQFILITMVLVTISGCSSGPKGFGAHAEKIIIYPAVSPKNSSGTIFW